jgi:hypothetical protein
MIHQYVSNYLLITVPVLGHAGPDCDPCDGPLKGYFQSWKKANILVYKPKFGWKMNMVHFYNFLFTFNQAIKRIIYVIFKK